MNPDDRLSVPSSPMRVWLDWLLYRLDRVIVSCPSALGGGCGRCDSLAYRMLKTQNAALYQYERIIRTSYLDR